MSFFSLLPYAFKFLSFGLKIWGASQETNEKFLALIDSAKNDGLITVKARDEFVSQKQKIIERQKAEAERRSKMSADELNQLEVERIRKLKEGKEKWGP